MPEKSLNRNDWLDSLTILALLICHSEPSLNLVCTCCSECKLLACVYVFDKLCEIFIHDVRFRVWDSVQELALLIFKAYHGDVIHPLVNESPYLTYLLHNMQAPTRLNFSCRSQLVPFSKRFSDVCKHWDFVTDLGSYRSDFILSGERKSRWL